jgi:hypothetical protein
MEYAFAQFRGNEVPFNDSWPGDPRDYPGTLLTDTTQDVEYSVVTEDDSLGVHLKIRFCSGLTNDAASCVEADELSADAKAVWYSIDQPFYIGERTELELVIDEVPAGRPAESDVVMVDKCTVKGCVDSVGMSGDFCRTDRTHFCE